MRQLTLTFLFFAFGTSFIHGGELSKRLPPNTVCFLELDLARALKDTEAYLSAIDAESTKAVVSKVKYLWDQIIESAAAHEFKANLLRSIAQTKLYVVVLAKSTPKVTVHTVEVPDFTSDVEEDERPTQTMTVTSVESFTFAVVVESTPELAADFLAKSKRFLESLKEKYPDRQDTGWREIDVDEGELLAVGGKKQTAMIGRHGPYLIFSDTDLEEFWKTLSVTHEPSLADSETLLRFTGQSPQPLLRGVLEFPALFRSIESAFKARIEHAKENPASNRNAEGANNIFGIQSDPTEELESFEEMRKLFALDQVRELGLHMTTTASGSRADGKLAAELLFRKPLHPFLSNLFNGGPRLGLPPIGEKDGVGFFGRVGLGELFEDRIAQLNDEDAIAYQNFSVMMKTMVGFDFAELVKQFSGDAYLIVDIVEREHPSVEYNEETEEFENKTVKGPIPEVLILAGLNDRSGFQELLSNTLNKLNESFPLISTFLKKRTYQETPVHVIGFQVEEDQEPDGLQSFAAAIVDRYWAFGSWNDITRLIRQSRASDVPQGRLLRSLTENRDASFLLAVPRSFTEKIEQMGQVTAEARNQAVLDELKAMLPFLVEDEETSRKIEQSVSELINVLQKMEKSSRARSKDPLAFKGQLHGARYDLSVDFGLAPKESEKSEK